MLVEGTRLGPYEIVKLIGVGGMGEVYHARDLRLRRDVAIKIISTDRATDPRAIARFEHEARAVAALSHPHIVALYDVGNENGVVYAVMELLDGESLTSRIVREGVPWRRALEIAAAIADGLSAAHAKGIAHRDLKPANVFMIRDGQVKILDFGLAAPAAPPPWSGDPRSSADVDTQTSPGLGTVGYLAPEQIRGEASDARSDIFAVGCVLFEMLTGRRAFPGETAAESITAILRKQPADLDGSGLRFPASIASVVHRCLEKDPEQRFQSARDLAFALRAILADSGGAESTAVNSGLGRRRYVRNTVLSAAALVSIAVIAMFATGTSPTRLFDSTGNDGVRLDGGRRIDPRANDDYVKGRYYYNQRSAPDLQRAVEHFRRAIDVDPTYASAYAGLADAYSLLGYQNYLAPREAFPKATAAARRAIDLDGHLADPHASLGYVHLYYDWDFAAADAEFTRAIELNPNLVPARHFYSILLTALLRPTEAREQIERARSLDPLSPLVASDMGFELYYAGQYDEAAKALRDAIEMGPKAAAPRFWLGRVYQAQEKYPEALAEYRAGGADLAAWPPSLSGVGHLHGLLGDRRAALDVLSTLEAMAQRGYVSAYTRALVYLGLGETAQTFEWLERAYEERSNWMVWLLKDPRWDPVRSEPRFAAMLDRVGFPAKAKARAADTTTPVERRQQRNRQSSRSAGSAQ
jgi:serine/threonine protein kinase/Flp pilus assembly protein TadD